MAGCASHFSRPVGATKEVQTKSKRAYSALLAVVALASCETTPRSHGPITYRVPAAKKPAPSRPSPEEFLRLRDTNKDGSITLKEYIGNPKARNVPALNKNFNRRDANKDGKLTLEELKNK